NDPAVRTERERGLVPGPRIRPRRQEQRPQLPPCAGVTDGAVRLNEPRSVRGQGDLVGSKRVVAAKSLLSGFQVPSHETPALAGNKPTSSITDVSLGDRQSQQFASIRRDPRGTRHRI